MNAIAGEHNYVCPNCNTVANGNYCPQCGQETHLHKDTFWGLLSHFVAHYFHYDSKFWKTLKALLFYPGKLTLEYRAKHRMRYIPPISLYIFITVLFFLMYSIVDSHSGFNKVHMGWQQQDSVASPALFQTPDSVDVSLAKQGIKNSTKAPGKIKTFLKWYKAKTEKAHKTNEELNEEIAHSFPKMFFFMIPVLALLLKICFIRNKGYYFVDHAVFALHVHSFAFIVMLLGALNPFESFDDNLSFIITFLCALYFVLSLRKVYHTGWTRSLFTLLFVSLGYFIFLLIIFLAAVLILAAL